MGNSNSNSTIIERWWILTLASLMVVVLFFIHHTPGSNTISVLQNLKMVAPDMQSPNNDESAAATTSSSNNQFSISNKLQSCIPLNKDITQTSSNLPGLENSKPDLSDHNMKQPTLSFQVPFPGLQDAKLPSELTDKAEATPTTSSSSDHQQVPVLDAQIQEPEEEGMKYCNIFQGKWVYDPIESPLYEPAMCPFFSDTTSCRRNGRPDKEYEKWRWEAKDCTIPRFNAKDMLERLRGKRVVIIGDSINYGQFESLACLLYSAIPDKSYVDIRNRVFRAESYDLVIESHWAQFLVEVLLNKTDGKKTLKLDSLASTSWKWKDADIMLFNTGHWWGSRDRWDWFQYKRKVFADMKVETAFKVAMKTWARWIEKNVDTSKTTVYFRGMSPAHFGKDWCYKSTKPIMDESYSYKKGKSLKEIVEKTIQGMKTVPVKYLNITKLSEYRPDAHSSIYSTKQGKLLIATKQKPPAMVADCSHWCLPGVPDTWNHLLYATMVLDSSRGISSTSPKL